jgi:hypothetical protein
MGVDEATDRSPLGAARPTIREITLRCLDTALRAGSE